MVPPNVQKLYINLFFFIDPRTKSPKLNNLHVILCNYNCMWRLGSGIRLTDVVNFQAGKYFFLISAWILCKINISIAQVNPFKLSKHFYLHFPKVLIISVSHFLSPLSWDLSQESVFNMFQVVQEFHCYTTKMKTLAQ